MVCEAEVTVGGGGVRVRVGLFTARAVGRFEVMWQVHVWSFKAGRLGVSLSCTPFFPGRVAGACNRGPQAVCASAERSLLACPIDHE